MTRTRAMFTALAAALLLPLVAHAQGANAAVAKGSPTTDRLPIYEIDPTWPPTLPNDWILGDIRGLFVDDKDHLWVIHMPSSLTDQEIGAASKPPIADCCLPAPPVLELDADGKVLRTWGGPSPDDTWFNQEHGIYYRSSGLRVDRHRQRHARDEVDAGWQRSVSVSAGSQAICRFRRSLHVAFS